MPEEMSFDEASYQVERGFLRRLAKDDGDPTIRELADEILAGNITWSAAARSAAYADALAETMEPIAEDPRLLSPEAVAGWERDARAFVATLAEEANIVITGLPRP